MNKANKVLIIIGIIFIFGSCYDSRQSMIDLAVAAYKCGHTAGALAYQDHKDDENLDEFWIKQQEDVNNYRRVLSYDLEYEKYIKKLNQEEDK